MSPTFAAPHRPAAVYLGDKLGDDFSRALAIRHFWPRMPIRAAPQPIHPLKVSPMPRSATPLTVQQVVNAKPGRHGLGNGLYLLVRNTGARFWLFRWTRDGKMREMGLGRAPGRLQDQAAVPLREATETAGRLLREVRAGRDPIAVNQR